jgi:hypothetical protein
MSSPLPIPPPGFDNLSKEEKLTYVEELLTYISAAEQVEIPDWHREILDQRIAKYRAEGFIGIPWEEFEQELTEGN